MFSPPICSLLNVRLNRQGVDNISHNLCQEEEHLAGEGRLTHSKTSFIWWKFKCWGQKATF